MDQLTFVLTRSAPYLAMACVAVLPVLYVLFETVAHRRSVDEVDVIQARQLFSPSHAARPKTHARGVSREGGAFSALDWLLRGGGKERNGRA